jgi:zinc transport system substrate-binding protein
MVLIMKPASRRPVRMFTALAAVTAMVAITSACNSGPPAGGPGAGAVVTSFYPLQFVTQQITGGTMPVTVLTKPGAEPHDLELAPQDVADMTNARLVVYADGFQPAVDDAMAQVDDGKVLDVADAADLTLTASEEHEAETPAEHTQQGGHDHTTNDPHFWLDPKRYAAVAEAIGTRLQAIDPANASRYATNTGDFVAELNTLDAEYASRLANCRRKVLVTSHAAFGYLAQRYGLEQHGITGVSPDAEPSPAALKEVSDLVRNEGVTMIYQETLVEPHLARTVADSTGANVATLDPVEESPAPPQARTTSG